MQKKTNTKTFGDLLQRKRIYTSQSIPQVAGKLGVNPITIRRWESGEYGPRSKEQYAKVAEVYGLSQEEIFRNTGISITSVTENEIPETVTKEDLLPLIKLIVQTQLTTLDRDEFEYLSRAFSKSDGVDFDVRTIEILIKFRD